MIKGGELRTWISLINLFLLTFLIFLKIRSNKKRTLKMEETLYNILIQDNSFDLENKVKHLLEEEGEKQALTYIKEHTGLGLLCAMDYMKYVMIPRV